MTYLRAKICIISWRAYTTWMGVKFFIALENVPRWRSPRASIGKLDQCPKGLIESKDGFSHWGHTHGSDNTMIRDKTRAKLRKIFN